MANNRHFHFLTLNVIKHHEHSAKVEYYSETDTNFPVQILLFTKLDLFNVLV